MKFDISNRRKLNYSTTANFRISRLQTKNEVTS